MGSLVESLARLKGRRVLVTGSTGFKGSWLCTWLAEAGAKVSGFALPPEPDAPLFDQLRLRDRIDQHDGDIRDPATVTGVLKQVQPEVVIHLAAQALVRRSYDEPKATFDTNAGGAVNLMEAVRATPSVASLVFITSDKCYRNKEWIWGYRENDELGGPDPYSASKAAAEQVFEAYHQSFLARRAGFAACTARAGNVIGGGDMSADRIVPDSIRALRDGRAIELRNPLSTRPWQHVLEPLSGYVTLAARMLDAAPDGTGWNFGPDAENVRTVQELAERAVGVWGSGEVRIVGDAGAPHESRLLMLSSDKAKSLLGWRPRWNFLQSVERTIGWYARLDQGVEPVGLTVGQIAEYVAAADCAP